MIESEKKIKRETRERVRESVEESRRGEKRNEKAASTSRRQSINKAMITRRKVET